MTYKTFIDSHIFTEVREARAWPSDDATALADQLRIVWAAVLLMGKKLPKELFGSLVKTADLTEKEFFDYPVFDLPADYFTIRDDAGVVSFKVDQEHRYLPRDLVSFTVIRESIDNPFQDGNVLIHIDRDVNELHLLGGYEISMTYLPFFTEPTSGNYATEQVPIPSGYREELVQLIATHVEAVKTGNLAKSQVHGLLAELYGASAATIDKRR